jgi:putative acetyltransferase
VLFAVDLPANRPEGWRHDELDLRREDLDSPAVQELFAALNAEISRRYPEEGPSHFRLDAEEIVNGRGALLVAYLADRPVGCGSIRKLDDDAAEIKRMYVSDDTRGRGIGRTLLRALEAEAHDLAVRRILVETGEHQEAALALYEGAGFQRVDRFSEYSTSALSVCLAKEI